MRFDGKSLLPVHQFDGYLAFDEDSCRKAGKALRSQYLGAAPFPHVACDDFLPADLLKRVVDEFPSTAGKSFFDDAQTKFKYSHSPRECSAITRNLFAELNGKAFLSFLEEMTGIEGLIADSGFEGGGLHETTSGGRLNIHADFTMHKTLRLERRLNLLIYLNDDWRPEYGGNLELWDKRMKSKNVEIAPVLGRAVIFSTSRNSYHGQPDPVTCPANRSRRSIAIYYYTAPKALVTPPDRLTDFKARPGSNDKVVRGQWREHLLREWLPPKLLRLYQQRRGEL